MHDPIAWFARNSVVANLLVVLILAAGALALGNLKKEIFPEISLGIISVAADYRGAGPKEVEEAICIRLEEAVQEIEGIKKIASTASEGRGVMTLEIDAGYSARQVLSDVKATVDAIDTFPDEVQKPVIREARSRFQVINISISGETDLASLKRLGERIRDEITARPGISHAELLGAPPYEISIEVPEEALRRLGLTFDEIANAVRRFSVDLPGGSIRTASGDVLLRTEGQAFTGMQFERLPLLTRTDGTRIYLGDVATVIDGFADIEVAMRLDGKPSLVVEVYRVGDQSAVSVAEAVHNYVAETAPTMPDGVAIATWQDRSQMLEDRIDVLTKNALSGLLLVFAVLALFVRLRLAFWTTLGIPISFLGAISLLPLLGVSINMMSLFSFVLVLGIVVDDAVVVGESIHTAQVRAGRRSTSAAIRGTHAVLVPVTFGVLTTMAAFAPMLFVSGTTGKLMAVLPLVVLPTLFFSLVESNLILPSHLSRRKRAADSASRHALARGWSAFFDAFATGLEWFVRNVYRPTLAHATEWRYLTIALGISLVSLTLGLVMAGHVRVVLFPVVESDNVVAFLTMPRETPASVTAAGVARIERSAMELRRELSGERGQDPFLHILSSVGEHPFRMVQLGALSSGRRFQGDHLGEVNINLVPAETRKLRAVEIASRLREKVGRIPGAVELTITHDLIDSGKAIDLQFVSSNIDTIREVAKITKARLTEYPGVIEITDTYRGGKPEIKLTLTSEGEALGLTLQDLGLRVRQGFYGEEAQRIQRDRDDVRVMVRYPLRDRRSLATLEQMRIRTPTGHEVPFSSVAVASMGRGPSSITRVDRNRAIHVQAEVDDSLTTSRDVIESLRAEFLPQLMDRYPGVTYSFVGDEAEFAESMDGLVRGAFAAMFAIFAMLAIPLKSYSKPAIILSAIPFGMVGAIWGHWIFGVDISFMSMCGMVALAGVVVNDALMLVAFVRKYTRRQQGSLRMAVQRAGEARFRAILLTSLTTVAGVTPLMLDKSLQAQFLIPMALALASGVLFATGVTLVLVPALYLALEDVGKALRWLVGK